MSTGRPPGGISRRNFIKGLGAAGAGLLLPGIGYLSWQPGLPRPVAAHPLSPARSVSMALLWPQAGGASAQLASWQAGFALKAAQVEGQLGGRPFTLKVQTVGPAGVPQVQAQALLEAGADLLIGGFGTGVAGQMAHLLEQYDATLVTSAIGINIPRRNELSPRIFHAGSSQWQADWALGVHAAQTLGRRAVLAASLYEGGYDALYAFRRGFESAGGQVLDSLVTHRPMDRPDHLTAVMATLAATPADFVYAAHTRRDAQEFLTAYRRAGLARRLPLLGTGWLTEDETLAALGETAQGLLTAVPWQSGLASGQAFEQAFQAQYQRPADAFAALGYQTAQLLDAALAEAGGEIRGPRLRKALAVASFEGPSGPFQMDPALQAGATPVYLRQVRDGHNRVLGRLAGADGLDIRLDPLYQEPRSGWTNAYLCA